MLEQTFCHIPGIGEGTERALWRAGCHSWTAFLENPSDFSVGSACKKTVIDAIQRSQAALSGRHHQFFKDSLPNSELWRAWPDFRDRCVYLDIETDGGQSGNSVTMVGLYDGAEFTCLVRDDGLENFRDVISQYSMIVTFFGSCFDLPMLMKRFRGLEFDQLHLDLCPTLRRLGLRGGLKAIEKQVGLSRSEETTGLSGYDAVRLWRQHQWGSSGALDTLIAYNREDVVNLEHLATMAYEQLKAQTFDDGQEAQCGSAERKASTHRLSPSSSIP